ncbi:MAG TPA: dihydropteroate synthase [Acidisarcina sp.]
MAFTRRTPFLWKLLTRSLELGRHTRVMGVINVTPDSFSDGGRFLSAAEAVDCALAMFDEGADIVDIGGESTRPGKLEPFTEAEEQHRVLPVIAGILQQRPDSLLSIDTYRAATARAAVAAGAQIVNDVSGLLWDEQMAGTCASLGCGVVLMHTRGRPGQWARLPRLAQEEVVPLVKRQLRERLAAALAAGISAERLVLDPGFGFGKAYENNYPLLSHLEDLRELGQPLLAGVSRKSFLGRTLAGSSRLPAGQDVPVGERAHASLAATTAAMLGGSDIVRVHEVRSTVEAAAIADEILNAG